MSLARLDARPRSHRKSREGRYSGFRPRLIQSSCGFSSASKYTKPPSTLVHGQCRGKTTLQKRHAARKRDVAADVSHELNINPTFSSTDSNDAPRGLIIRAEVLPTETNKQRQKAWRKQDETQSFRGTTSNALEEGLERTLNFSMYLQSDRRSFSYTKFFEIITGMSMLYCGGGAPIVPHFSKMGQSAARVCKNGDFLLASTPTTSSRPTPTRWRNHKRE